MARYRGYRPDAVRLQHYDYAQGGWYHLVACTKDRRPDFGMVRNGIVGLSVAGCIAAWAWPRTLRTYPRAVEDEWIIMPNHVHLLLGLRARQDKSDDADRSGDDVKTRRGASQRKDDRTFDGGLVPHSVSSIMNHYKDASPKPSANTRPVPASPGNPGFTTASSGRNANCRPIAATWTKIRPGGPMTATIPIGSTTSESVPLP